MDQDKRPPQGPVSFPQVLRDVLQSDDRFHAIDMHQDCVFVEFVPEGNCYALNIGRMVRASRVESSEKVESTTDGEVIHVDFQLRKRIQVIQSKQERTDRRKN